MENSMAGKYADDRIWDIIIDRRSALISSIWLKKNRDFEKALRHIPI